MIDYRPKGFHALYSRYISWKTANLVLTTLFFNLLHLCFSIISVVSFKKAAFIQKIVVVGFGGIGNHLMLVPAIEYLKTTNPRREIHVVASSRASAEILEGNPSISSISVCNGNHLQKFHEIRSFGKTIADEKPDAVLMASGFKPEVGSLASFFSHASVRAGEDWRGRGFLYTAKTAVDPYMIEFKRNIEIAKLLGEGIETDSTKLYLRDDELLAAREWLSIHVSTNTKVIIGIHPGSGLGQEWKRWDVERFLGVAKQLSLHTNTGIIFFIGPEEAELESIIRAANMKSAFIFRNDDSIRKTAAMIQCCDYFISNDSGLHQIALALKIQSLGIFGPTSIEKNFIGGERHTAIFAEGVKCRPCHYSYWFLACGSSRPCLEMISPDQVSQLVIKKSSSQRI